MFNHWDECNRKGLLTRDIGDVNDVLLSSVRVDTAAAAEDDAFSLRVRCLYRSICRTILSVAFVRFRKVKIPSSEPTSHESLGDGCHFIAIG